MALGMIPKVTPLVSFYPFSACTQTHTPLSHKPRGPIPPWDLLSLVQCPVPAEMCTTIHLSPCIPPQYWISAFLCPVWVQFHVVSLEQPPPVTPLYYLQKPHVSICSTFPFHGSHRVWLSAIKGGIFPLCLPTPWLKGSTSVDSHTVHSALLSSTFQLLLQNTEHSWIEVRRKKILIISTVKVKSTFLFHWMNIPR